MELGITLSLGILVEPSNICCLYTLSLCSRELMLVLCQPWWRTRSFTDFHSKANHSKHSVKMCRSWSRFTLYSTNIYFGKPWSLPLCFIEEFFSPYCQQRFLSFCPSHVQCPVSLAPLSFYWELPFALNVPPPFPLNLDMPSSLSL